MNTIKNENFNVVGITGMSHQINSAYYLANEIKMNSSCKVVIGGCHATFCPEEALKNGADFVVVGEGERTFAELLDSMGEDRYDEILGLAYKKDGEIFINPPRPLLDLDTLPPPARDLSPMAKYVDARIFGRPALEFMFGRGCTYNCIFCSSPKMWERKVRLFDLDRIIDEVKYVTKKYRNSYIFITDDVFTVKRKFVLDFCEKIKNLNLKWACISRVDLVDKTLLIQMKEAGCVWIIYGVESGSQRILDFERKGITIERIKETFRLHREIGLPARALMIVGHPLETEETIQGSINLVKEINPLGGVFGQMMTPYVGTELYDSIAHQTGRIDSYNWDDYVTWKYPPIFVPHGLNGKTIYEVAQAFSKAKGMSFRDYLTVYKLVGVDIFNWEFLFRPIIVGILKRILPAFLIKRIKWLRDKIKIEV